MVAVGGHGVDAQFQQVAAYVLEQTGVLKAADDVGVDLPGFIGLDEFALDLLAVDPHGKAVDVGALGYGEDVGCLKGAVRVIAEDLSHFCGRYLLDEAHLDVMTDHCQWRRGRGGWNEEATGRE